MNRSRLAPGAPPKRRQPLRSGGSLARSGSSLARSGPIKAKPVDPAAKAERAAVVAAAEERDRVPGQGGTVCVGRGLIAGHVCIGGSCGHELKKRSAKKGAALDVDNVATVCTVLNSDVEDYPDWAHAHGLVARFGMTSDDCWERMAAVRRDGVDLAGIACPPVRT